MPPPPQRLDRAAGPRAEASAIALPFRYLYRLVEMATLCTAIRVWTIAQVPGVATDLDQLICDSKTLRGSVVPTVGGG